MSYDEFEMPESLETSNFLSADGWYHVMVTKVDTTPSKDDGSPVNGKKFSFRVLDGTDPSQKGCTHNELIGNVSMSHKDGGEFSRKVNARAAIAMNCLQKTAQGKVQVDWNRALGQTLVVKVVHDKENEKYLRIDGAHYYHITDDEVAKIPKDMALVHSGQQQPAQAPPRQQMPQQMPPQQGYPQQAPPQQAPPQQQSMLPPGYQPPVQQAPQQMPQQQPQQAYPPQQGYPPQQPASNGQPVGLDQL